jgi:hypothetical protein
MVEAVEQVNVTWIGCPKAPPPTLGEQLRESGAYVVGSEVELPLVDGVVDGGATFPKTKLPALAPKVDELPVDVELDEEDFEDGPDDVDDEP